MQYVCIHRRRCSRMLDAVVVVDVDVMLVTICVVEIA